MQPALKFPIVESAPPRAPQPIVKESLLNFRRKSFLQTLLNSIITRCAVCTIRFRGKRILERLRSSAKHCEAAQKKALKRILRSSAGSSFGMLRKLGRIRNVRDFRLSIPLYEYDDLAPWISQHMHHEAVLTVEEPCAFNLTSGTTGPCKYLPVLMKTLRWNRDAQMVAAYTLLLNRPDFLNGEVLAITGPPLLGHTGRGIEVGTKSGQVLKNLNRIIKRKYIIPEMVQSVADYELKYLLILRIVLSTDYISYVQTANISTLLLLSELLNFHAGSLLDDLEQGTFFRWDDLSDELKKEIAPLIKAHQPRAAHLRTSLTENRSLQLMDILPRVQAVGTWTNGSSRMFVSRLREELPEKTLIRDLGYIASELHGTIPLDAQGELGLPTLDRVFFEFVPRESWEQGNRETLLLHELELHRQYYVVISTEDGLLRYKMNDILEVTGREGNTPLFRFIQKGQGVTSVTGEKLGEAQFLTVMANVERRNNLAAKFYVMVADPNKLHYTVYYEATDDYLSALPSRENELAAQIDDLLCEVNYEYREKRASMRLKPAQLKFLKPGTFREARRAWVAQGRFEGQFKLIALRYLNELTFPFPSHVQFP